MTKILLTFTAFWLSGFLTAQRELVPHFEAETIDAEVAIGYGVAIGDVDGDGRPDILLADKKRFVWYRNPDWKRFLIYEDLTERDNVCLAVRDLNGDGRVELAVGAQWNPSETTDESKSGSVHYLKAPVDRTRPWTPVPLPHEPTVHRMQWVRTADGIELVVVPLHGRGNRDGEGAGVRVLSYRIDPSLQSAPHLSLINDEFHMTHNFDPINWDDDPEEEILLAGREGIFLLDQKGSSWVRSQISNRAAGEVRGGRLAGGRRMVAAIEPMHGDRAAVYVENSEGWTRVQLDDSLNQGHALASADLLGLGYDQVVVGWREPNASGRVGIKLFVPVGGKADEWNEYWIDDNQMACEDLIVADLDGDGRPEIIAAGRRTRNLVIYWNRTARP